MMNRTLSTYRAIDTHGKSQLELILMVYDGALAAYRESAKAYEKDDSQVGYDQLERAKRFMVHLYTTLNPEKGGDIAANLGKLYTYVINQTNMVQATKDLAQIDDITKILGNLRLAWSGLQEQQMTENPKQPSEQAPVVNGGFSTSG